MLRSEFCAFLGFLKYPGQIRFLSNPEVSQDDSEALCCLDSGARVKNLKVKMQHSKRRFPAMTHANNILHGFEQFLVRS